jgi:hypothetical protein
MSSLRNSLHRRNHKERSQLAHRSRLGILEKHKDYVKRARDFHSKKDRIKRLREKAADRNKDEFYFGMHKSKTEVCYSDRPILFVSNAVYCNLGGSPCQGQRKRFVTDGHGESSQVSGRQLYPRCPSNRAEGTLPYIVFKYLT